jgi:hypothetical protein
MSHAVWRVAARAYRSDLITAQAYWTVGPLQPYQLLGSVCATVVTCVLLAVLLAQCSLRANCAGGCELASPHTPTSAGSLAWKPDEYDGVKYAGLPVEVRQMYECTTAATNLVVLPESSIFGPLCWSKRADVRYSYESDLSQSRTLGTGLTDFDLAVRLAVMARTTASMSLEPKSSGVLACLA